MKRLSWIALPCALGLAACGGDDGNDDGGDKNPPAPALDYTDPAGGALRLVKNQAGSTETTVALELVVGERPLTGYSTGFNLPLAPGLVTFAGFVPGAALDPGSAPIAAQALVPASGPLAGVLVAAQSQKAAGTGAVPTDAALAPGSVLFTVKLDLVPGAAAGVVFDGTAADFALPSGGLRDRAGLTVVEAKDVAIGKLQVIAAP